MKLAESKFSQIFCHTPIYTFLIFLVLVIFSYGEIINYYFTDVDTFSLINHGRYQNLGDLWTLFSSELMAGRMVNAIYYRPFLSFIYGTEFYFFGLNPRGYHVVDLTLFFATPCLMVLFTRRLWGKVRGTMLGLVSGTLFILHPLNIDNVPGVARLGDLLSTFLAILAITAFFYYLTQKTGRVRKSIFYLVSLVSAILAFASKEPAIVLVGVLMASIFIFDSHPNVVGRLKRMITISLPFLLLFGSYYLWRRHIIGGMGGYVNRKGEFAEHLFSFNSIKQSFVGNLFGFFFGSISDNFDKYSYYFLDRSWLIYLLIVLMIVSLFRWLTPRVKTIVKTPFSMEENTRLKDLRMGVLCGIFLLGNLTLITLTLFSMRYLYLSLIPFGIICAILLDRVFSQKPAHWRQWVGASVFIFLLISGYFQSPLWYKNKLRRWKIGGEISRTFLEDLEVHSARDPQRDIFLINIPYVLNISPSLSTLFFELPFNQLLLEHAIVDYMDLMQDITHKKYSSTVAVNYLYLTDFPENLDVNVTFVSKHDIRVNAKEGAVPSEFPWTIIPGRYEKKHLFELFGGRLRFQNEPKKGWSKTQRIRLTDQALQKDPLYLTFESKGLRVLKPENGTALSSSPVSSLSP